MWHRRRYFPGKGIFWLFILLFIFGGSGKSGFPGFIFPLLLIWFVGPVFFAGFARSNRKYIHPDRRPGIRRPSSTQNQKVKPVQSAVPRASEPSVSIKHSLAGLPSNCKACGGPANETTISWRGSKAYCGYCSSGL